MPKKPIISKEISKYLFLSNLSKKENKHTSYLDSLEHKLNFCRNKKIIKKSKKK